MIPSLYSIPGPWPGKLAIVARPRGGDWLDDEVTGWHQAGLDVVVSLLEKDEALGLGLSNEGLTAEAHHVRFISFPIPDRDIPTSLPNALRLLKQVAKDLQAGNNIAIHCRQGLGRSALIAAGVLVTAGVTAEQAIESVREARGQSVPETPHQLLWIQQLPVGRAVLTH